MRKAWVEPNDCSGTMRHAKPSGDARADVCLLVEGAYPFISGGVSSWLHELISSQKHLTFHIVALSPDSRVKPHRYELPQNVTGFTDVALQQKETAIPTCRSIVKLIRDLEAPLTSLVSGGGLRDFRQVMLTLHRHHKVVSRAALMNSEPAFEMVKRMYEGAAPGNSFINFFWSWRALVGGLYSVLLSKLPEAGVYHAISTGYAGLAMARATLATGRPGILTEHGIYTNERRIEIRLADWLADDLPASLGTEDRRRDLRDFWAQAFQAYSRICYEACSRIITLYSGNQVLQSRDGAPADRLAIIPNGIDYDDFASIRRSPGPRRPAVALIGRIVPIKDVKTFIRAAAILQDTVTDVRVLVLGPTEEDFEYYRECQELVGQLGLGDAIEFTGRVNLREHLGSIDVIVLTSISEAQPLVLLEAGAAGIPSVATDVGSCREILLGHRDEEPLLGAGGIVTPLANPAATANAVARLITDQEFYRRCSRAIQERTKTYYNKKEIDQVYSSLYEEYLARPDVAYPRRLV